MITARPPFEGESPFAIAYQHVQEDPNPPSDFIADLSPTAALNIDAVALTAMAKHPADRYQSAAEFAEDLKRVSRNAVSQAARSHLTTTDAPRRGAGAAAGAAGAAGAAALGGAADTAATQIVPVAGAGVPSMAMRMAIAPTTTTAMTTVTKKTSQRSVPPRPGSSPCSRCLHCALVDISPGITLARALASVPKLRRSLM